MEFCHTNPILRSAAIEQLCQFVLEWQTQWKTSTPDYERFEHELHEKMMAIEREILTEELARYDIDAEQIEVGGVMHRQALTSSKTYLSAAGPMTVERHLYRPAGRGSRSICPLELRAGILRGYWTPRAARQAAIAMARLLAIAKPCLVNWAGCSLRGPAWTDCPKSCLSIGKFTVKNGKLPCAPRRLCHRKPQ